MSNIDNTTPEQLQESDRFAEKLRAIYLFLRYQGGNLDGSVVSDLANHHAGKTYTAAQLWADAVALEKLSRELKQQAQQLASQQERIYGTDRPN